MGQNKTEWDNWRSRKQEEGNKEHGRKEVREGEMEGRKEGKREKGIQARIYEKYWTIS